MTTPDTTAAKMWSVRAGPETAECTSASPCNKQTSLGRRLPSSPDIPQLDEVDHALSIVLDEDNQVEDVVRRKIPRCPMGPRRFNEQQIQLRLAQAIIVKLPLQPRVTPGQIQDS